MREKLRSVWCALFQHTPIQDTFFGYWNCARCGAQLGDSLGGAYTGGIPVSGLHEPGCETCVGIYREMKWYDFVMVSRESKRIAKINGTPASEEVLSAWRGRKEAHKKAMKDLHDKYKEAQ